MLSRVVHFLILGMIYLCAATTLAQAIGLGVIWSRGALTPDKLTRYAGILYGLPPQDLPPLEPNEEESTGLVSGGSADLQTRVAAHPLLANRREAIQRDFTEINMLVRDLKTKRKRYDSVKKGFQNLLDTLETDLSTTSIAEVQRTLEVLQAKQAKDLILGMLEEEDPTGEDDVLGDVVEMIRTMPQEKLKKILGEFKTNAERETLHRIMMELGKLDAAGSGASQP
jgi:hypothetical protein